MKFNKLAKDLNMSVGDLAEAAVNIVPRANGGTDVSEAQREQIVQLLKKPASADLPVPKSAQIDPVLAVLIERISAEVQTETPDQIVDEMVTRYVQDPEDLPEDPEYREAIIAYVELVKKRQLHRRQQSLNLRSLINRRVNGPDQPLVLEAFYSVEPSSDSSSATLNGNARTPQLKAAGS